MRPTEQSAADNDTQARFEAFQSAMRLDSIVPGRYHFLLLITMWIRAEHGQNPFTIREEIECLEDQSKTSRTKSPTQFLHPPLKGLWKKHYIRTDMKGLIKNLESAHGEKGKVKLARKLIAEQGIKSPEQLSREFADGYVRSYRYRSRTQTLTGDWLIYVQHEGKNYYLAVYDHETKDEQIAQELKRHLPQQFPFITGVLGL
jgi:hypothetical protein